MPSKELLASWKEWVWNQNIVTTVSTRLSLSHLDPVLLLAGSQSCPTLQPQRLQPTRLLCPWDSLDQSTGVGCHALLQRVFPTQGSNPGLLHCRWILYRLSHQGSPRLLEWVAYLLSRGSSWPRNQTGVSCIAGRFFTSWATWEDRTFYIHSSNMHF